MINTILEISLSTSVVILLVLILNSFIDKRYMAKGKYILWLILAVRLIIPVNITLPQAPVTVTVPERTVVFTAPADRMPVAVMNESQLSEARKNPEVMANSAAYAPIMTLEQLAALIWLVGALALLLFHLINYWRFRAAVKPHLTKDGEYKGLTVYRCGGIESPMMTGFFRPAILLPETDFAPEELEVILTHEYVHYRRRDLWYKLLLILANAVHWFNPLVYLMVRQANRDLEYSCDDAVTKGRDLEFRKLYSMTILKTMKRGKKPFLSNDLSKKEED